ncbi:YciI family protein [Pelagibacterium limicola]|uniref:YciI family protein n=1 Tax=Pelagibacterium limicola TaxID=2791022 RepID=UPI001FE6C48F|nr:YciI family protein [Pelagibacterium limicola]
MRYMLMIYLDETKFEPMTQAERDGFTNGMLDFDEELIAGGHYVVSEALQLPSEAVTVRKWDGALSTTDGPFMETKEHLSGFFVIEARDLNEAIRVAGRMPLATMGSVEVRPLKVLERIPS